MKADTHMRAPLPVWTKVTAVDKAYYKDCLSQDSCWRRKGCMPSAAVVLTEETYYFCQQNKCIQANNLTLLYPCIHSWAPHSWATSGDVGCAPYIARHAVDHHHVKTSGPVTKEDLQCFWRNNHRQKQASISDFKTSLNQASPRRAAQQGRSKLQANCSAGAGHLMV